MSAWESKMEKRIQGLERLFDRTPNPITIEKRIEALEKKHGHLDKRMDGWVSQIIKYKTDIDDKIWDDKQEIAELREGMLEIETKYIKDRKTDASRLNPLLDCDGECGDCEDNITTAKWIPNLCGRVEKASEDPVNTTKPPEPNICALIKHDNNQMYILLDKHLEILNNQRRVFFQLTDKQIVEFKQFLGYYIEEWKPQLSEAMAKELHEEYEKWGAR